MLYFPKLFFYLQKIIIKAVVFDLDGVYFENGTQKFINSLKDKFNFKKDFDVIITSYEQKITKPSQEIFLYTFYLKIQRNLIL